MRVAIIPARGGSKRIPRKNIRLFVGRPMIGYAIRVALDSGLFDKVIVSTDDVEIASTAIALGAEVPFIRPYELSDDHTPTVPVVRHAILECQLLGWAVQEVCCIYPAVPFLRTEDLSAGYKLLGSRGGNGYTFAVTLFPAAIQRALRRSQDGTVTPFDDRYVNTRTQDLEPAYHDAGQFYWGRVGVWTMGVTVHSFASAIVMPEWRSIDIDTMDDWQRAEAMYEAIAKRAGSRDLPTKNLFDDMISHENVAGKVDDGRM